MNTPYVRAPHQEGSSGAGNHPAPNAALLIDFDNVTMGMRSDLSRELKSLLNSDIIKGKVAVQRAYADWRRYPQYIVPLSEASIDLIFAPAYGSSKKNATDIRMAIDGMELVFTRPEIGTFILLTGDSDFSSLVLKLKEYGKYVIGVGIQESSSDILVQNCDEYYSYTNLAGLRKTTDGDAESVDPWLLVEKALERMESRSDVMRSDRLKQVMLEIDAGFDESEYGFSKFSRFLTEASSKGLVELRRMENGQYEVQSSGGGGSARGGGTSRSSSSQSSGGRSSAGRSSSGDSGSSPSATRSRGRATRSRATRSGGGSRDDGRSESTSPAPSQKAAEASSGERTSDRGDGGDPLKEAYALLTDAIETVFEDRDITSVRDSDVKRKMLERDRSFDEAELGFSKFSLFLQQADEHGVVVLRQTDGGNYEVTLPGVTEESSQPEPEPKQPEPEPQRPEPRREAREAETTTDVTERAAEPASEQTPERTAEPVSKPSESRPSGSQPSRGLGPRRGERPGRRGRKADSAPPILEGQIVGSSSSGSRAGSPTSSDSSSAVSDPDELGLPTDAESVVRYLANSYKGVGEKTAEALVDELGPDLFTVLREDPSRIREVLPSNRAEQLLDAWNEDLERRRSGDDSGA